MKIKSIVAAVSFSLIFLVTQACEADQKPTEGMEKKVDSLNNAVMEQLKNDSSKQLK